MISLLPAFQDTFGLLMPRPLTRKQQKIYDYIRDQIVSRGYGPTVREIAEYMEINSPNGVVCHLKALEAKDKITRTANRSRSIELTESMSEVLSPKLEVRGRVLSGTCLLSSEVMAELELTKLVSAGRFLLLVRDDSLLNAHIVSGDQLIIDRRGTPSHGRLVVARINEREFAVRTWLADSGSIRLQPIDHNSPPTFVDSPDCFGVVVGVLRSFEGI